MTYPFVLSFSDGTRLTDENDGFLVLKTRWGTLNLSPSDPGIQVALEQLQGQGITQQEGIELALGEQEISSISTVSQFLITLEKIVRLGLIDFTVCESDRPIATLIPSIHSQPFQLSQVELSVQYRLSRFAYYHICDDRPVLETCLSPARIFAYNWYLGAILTALAHPCSFGDLVAQFPAISEITIEGILNLLVSAKMLVKSEDSQSEELLEPLQQWEFHDLLFHTRSRYGRHDYPIGQTFRFLDTIPPLPAIKPEGNGKKITLYSPDINSLIEHDRSFTEILEKRKSIRQYGEKPIDIKQLGEFLYRSARVRELVEKNKMECSDRPYPGSGNAYELEIYILSNTCEGLDRGLFHYCPRSHQLEHICSMNPHLKAILGSAQKTNFEGNTPQISIVLAARFARLTWRCQGLAYAAILKDVGCLYQTMYLVATAMDLAPSALGGGDSDRFARAAGTDYYVETSVGEFMLGSAPQLS